MEETKVIYHIDDENVPYLIKLPFSSEKVTLADLKNALSKPSHKYFFKSMDDDFGVVKEELIDDSARLPYLNGRVVCWLVAVEGSASDGQSQCTDTGQQPDGHQHVIAPGVAATPGGDGLPEVPPPRIPPPVPRKPDEAMPVRPPIPHPRPRGAHSRGPAANSNGHRYNDRMHGFDATSSVMSSDVEMTSFMDSEDDSRFSTASEATSMSSRYYKMRNRGRMRANGSRLQPISRTTSFSSITESTLSLNIIVVTLNLDTVTFLGISIVGQSNRTGDGGIYVGSIMKGGAVALDGRIEPGDMILEVNGVSFENMSNDDAVRTLRESVQKPGPITLVVAKCWDPNPKGYFAVPHQEAVRPIDPSAWVAHTEAARNTAPRSLPYAPSLSTVTSTSSSLVSSMPPEPERFEEKNLTTSSDMAVVVRAMAHPESGLEIRDRMWLKITIPNAFIGSELVDWLHSHVQGFANRSDARKYASSLLREGLIRHAVNKTKFSEQCYYVFNDAYVVEPPPPLLPLAPSVYPPPPGYSQVMSQFASPSATNNLSSLALEDIDSVSEVAAKKEHSMPSAPGNSRGGLAMWPGQYSTNPYGPSYLPPMAPPMARNYALPVMHGYDPASYVMSMPSGGNTSVVAESVQSSGSSTQSSNSQQMARDRERLLRSGIDGARHGVSHNGSEADMVGPMRSLTVAEKPLSPPPPINLAMTSADLAASRQSFKMAMGNAYADDTLQCMGDF